MGYIEKNVERSGSAQGVQGFADQFPRPAFLSAKDLPYLPPPYASLMQKVEASSAQLHAKAAAEFEAAFHDRIRAGTYPWSGALGLPEGRFLRAPESPGGALFSWVA